MKKRILSLQENVNRLLSDVKRYCPHVYMSLFYEFVCIIVVICVKYVSKEPQADVHGRMTQSWAGRSEITVVKWALGDCLPTQLFMSVCVCWKICGKRTLKTFTIVLEILVRSCPVQFLTTANENQGEKLFEKINNVKA